MGKFDERYKVYMDITAQSSWEWNDDASATWVEIFADISEFPKSLVDKELFLRYKWGITTFKNKPYDSESLYNTIEGLAVTQEIRIKIVTDNNTVRGYFGNNDCEYDDDNKFLTVTPAILDQYTEVLENIEAEVDVIGIPKDTTARWDFSAEFNDYDESHFVPLKVVASDIEESKDSETFATLPPTGVGGAIISSTRTGYNSVISFTCNADIIVQPATTLKFYIREYNSSNAVINESLLATYSEGTYSIAETFTYSPTISQNSYITIECIISSITNAEIIYNSLSVTINFESIPFSTISVEVKLASSNLISKSVWTEMLHGRASPKYTEWESTNGVDDYFDVSTGAPTGRWADLAFGPRTQAGMTVSNNKDMVNQPIDGLLLPDLETALGDFEYELSQATVYQGSFYREWYPFGARKRQVFGTCSFSREEYWKLDEGAPDPPTPGVGWVSTEVFDGSDRRLWIRKPLNGAYANTWTLGAKDTTGGTNSAFEWQEKKGTSKAYPDGDDSRIFSTSRTLYDVIKTIYNGMSDLLNGKDVLSTYFWNDNEGDLPFYDSQPSGTNYVTLETTNELNRIACIHTSVFNTESTELSKDEQSLKLSLTDMLEDLRKEHPIYWFVDSNSDLHIEHIKYLDMTLISVDVRGNPLIDETLKWKYDKSLMFATINYEAVNSGYVDFTNSTTEFNKIASNKRNQDIRLELKTEYLSTDIRYCIENPNDLNNGLVLVAYDANNIVITAPVPILGGDFENGLLAISNLLIKYWRYEGIWETGKINNVDYEFVETARTKIGKELNLKNVYDVDGSGNEIAFVTTEIGIGMIKTMVHDFNRGITTGVILKYRYNSSPDANGFQLITMADSLYNFGNYEN